MTLKQYAIRNSFDVKFVKNYKYHITAECNESSCEWRLHAFVLLDGETLKIKN